MALTYTIGTSILFDALPLLPKFSNAKLTVPTELVLGVGGYVNFGAVRAKTNPVVGFFLTDGTAIRLLSYCNNNDTTWRLSNCTISPTGLPFNESSVRVTSSSATAGLKTILGSGGANAEISDISIVNSSGTVLAQWLNQISDYNTTPNPSIFTITGTPIWGKKGIVSNYLTAALFISAITTPTQAVIVEVLDRSIDVSSIPATINGQTVTIQYTYAPATEHTVSFNSQGGSSVSSQTVANGSTATLPTAPTKTGYTFVEWCTDAGGTTPYNFSAPVTADLTLYAKWALVTYNITYVLDGGTNSGSNPATYTIETPTITLVAPTKAHYSFISWAPSNNIPLGSTGDKTFSASWLIDQVTLTFNSAGGSSVSPITLDYGATVTPPTAPTKTGYTFNGWNPALPETATISATYTAQWVAVEYTISYTLDGGTNNVSNPSYYTIESTDITLLAPTKTNYIFNGWIPTGFIASGSTGNKSFTATWSIVTHTVTFDSAGGSPTPATQTVNHGALATEPTAPTKTGYDFIGWDFDFSTPITANIVVTAQWNIKNFVVSFNSNGGSSVPSETVSYGGKVTRPTDPTRTGYTFVNWYSNAGLITVYDFDTLVTASATLYAKWVSVLPTTNKPIRTQIREALKDRILGMTKDNGYNFDWKSVNIIDPRTYPSVYIKTSERKSDFEVCSDVFSYILEVEFRIKVMSETSTQNKTLEGIDDAADLVADDFRRLFGDNFSLGDAYANTPFIFIEENVDESRNGDQYTIGTRVIRYETYYTVSKTEPTQPF